MARCASVSPIGERCDLHVGHDGAHEHDSGKVPGGGPGPLARDSRHIIATWTDDTERKQKVFNDQAERLQAASDALEAEGVATDLLVPIRQLALRLEAGVVQ